jgi:universal stress protein A
MAIKTILLPTDFSESALSAFKVACGLANQLGATLCILHVRDESCLRVAIKEGLLNGAQTDEQLEEAVHQLEKSRFERMLGCVDHTAIAVEQASRRGESAAAIVAYAIEIKADLVVIGRRGAGFAETLRSAVLGSVAETVVRKSPCPVLVVRRDHVAS